MKIAFGRHLVIINEMFDENAHLEIARNTFPFLYKIAHE